MAALMIGGASMPVSMGSAQSINLRIDLDSNLFIPRKKNKAKRQRQQQRLDREEDQYRIKPSDAVKRAMQAYPGSKALGVRALPGRPIYVVTLRSNNQVQRVRVNAITGAISGGN